MMRLEGRRKIPPVPVSYEQEGKREGEGEDLNPPGRGKKRGWW